MRNRSNIYLLGMMGVGKSTVGRLLAKRLGRSFLDLDTLIEEKSGRTIVQLFAELGEGGFRQLEKRVLRKVASQKKMVVALGGGSLLYAENRRLLHTTGINIYLEASQATLVERNRGQVKRPLLLKGQAEPGLRQRLRRLLSERRPLYESLCDITVNADRSSPGEMVCDIVERLEQTTHRLESLIRDRALKLL
jgi:shikimate kinase